MTKHDKKPRMSLKPISVVNSMSYEDFISLFGNVIEHCSLCAAAAWRDRPFSDVNSLHKSFCQFADQLPIGGKEGILRLHPDLAGRLAMSGGLTNESTKEQQSAGLNTLTDQEKQNMHHLNQQYKQKFGFPFVICARENKKEAILTGLENRLKNSGETEAVTGVEEVKKICRLRLLDIVDSSSKL
ncbi:2-oxo-4-hydroxy-4-carboxy-5-ureidoimidazoline decarboxylase-like [Mytilus trossulus]|uniref:2-oxo-4-hydroxy-4-carboxy-5-ureidoimidazoline decarboxylase-like n=1 Tax=Mytilus trossulus TaxID=6551 RepID=UPI003004D18C